MSTSGNLPAGQFTTQISGKQCTAIPRSGAQSESAQSVVASSTSADVAATPISTSAVQETTSPIAQASPIQPDVSQSTFSTSTTPAAVSTTTTPPPISTTSSIPVSTTSVVPPPPSPAPVETSSTEPPSSSIGAPANSATPASKLTTPTTSSRTSVIALSEIDTSTSFSSPVVPTAASNDQNSISFSITSQTPQSTIPTITTPAKQDQSSAASGISSSSKVQAGPIIGGVLGSVGLIAIIGVIFWFFRRGRRKRDSLLTPLTVRGEKSFYEIDNTSVSSTRRSAKWRTAIDYQTGKLLEISSIVGSAVVTFGSSLKSRVVGVRSDTPSVNLNRGNSQFLDGPIPQHSRNNSLLSNTTHVSAKEKLNDWWDRIKDNMIFGRWFRKQAQEPVDPFAAARSATERQANAKGQPDFSRLLGSDERGLQGQTERRRATSSSSIPNLGSLGIDFESHDPFADPVMPPKPQNVGWVPPNPNSSSNPFADPISQPERSVAKGKTYISDIRRSRGQSMDANNSISAYAANSASYRPPSTTVASRYPSSIAASRDSYRDTVFSVFSSNGRKGKGRSDPFDLERPELWHPKEPPVPEKNRTSTRPRGASIAGRDSAAMYPDPLQPKPGMTGSSDHYGAKARVVSNNSYASKYSSGVSSMGDWGEPGPDLGSGISSNSSLRDNASNTSSGSFATPPGIRSIYGQGSAVAGSLAEIQNSGNATDGRRAGDNVSLNSNASSKHGVGKAM